MDSALAVEFGSFELKAADVVAPLGARLTLVPTVEELSFRLDHHDTFQPRPRLGLLIYGAQIVSVYAAPCFKLTVVLVEGDVLLERSLVHAAVGRFKQRFDRARQGGRVVFHRHDVVGLLVHDLSNNLVLASHGINRDRDAFDIQCVEQLQDRRNLVAFNGGPDLTQNQACAAVQRRHQVSHVRARVMRAAQTFAVQGNHLSGQRRTQLLHPAEEVCLETLRLQQRKDPAEPVMRGNPVVKGQEALQPIHLEPHPLHHAHPVVRSTGHDTECHQQQLIQWVRAVADAGVFQLLKRFQKWAHLGYRSL